MMAQLLRTCDIGMSWLRQHRLLGLANSLVRFGGWALRVTSARKMTHQRASEGLAPVPTVAGLTHAAAIRLATFATVARLQSVTSFIDQLWSDLSSFACKTSGESFRELRHELDRRLDNRQRTAARLACRFVALRRFGRVVHQIRVMEVTTLRPLKALWRPPFLIPSRAHCDPETRPSPLSLSRPRTHHCHSRDRDSASTGSGRAGAGKCHGSRVAARNCASLELGLG